MTDPIRVGLAGYGHWGPMFVRNFRELPGADVAWVCDRDPARRADLTERYPDVVALDDFDAAIARGDADAVVIATPSTTHEPLAAAALEAGLHALVEKPIAMTGAGAERLGALAERSGLTLMVGHILRYNPAIQAIKKVIEDGDLGDLYYIASTRVNLGRHHRDVNVMWDLGPHDLSAILHLVGARPDAVSAWGRSFIIDQADVAFMYLRFPGGQVAHVHLSWLDPLKVRQMIVVGSRKMLVYDDVEMRITVHDKAVEQFAHPGTLEEFRLAYRSGEAREIPVERVEPLAVECAHFLECIRHGKQPVTGVREGADVVRVLEAAQASLDRSGGEVPVDWPDRRA